MGLKSWLRVAREDTEQSARDEFENGEMHGVVDYLIGIIAGLVDDDRVTIEYEQDRSALAFKIRFSNPDNNKLFVGPQFRVVNAVLEVIRFQQELKHNRYVIFELEQPDGRVQRICNRRTFSRSKVDLAEQVQASVQKALNASSAKAQIKALHATRDLIDALIEQGEKDG